MITADPFVIILILTAVGVNLFTELAVKIVEIIFITVFAEESVFVLLNS